MKNLLKLAAATAMAAGLVLGGANAQAQQKTPKDNPDKVLVIVNGHKITKREVEMAADDILPQLTQVPPKLRFAFIVEYLVERHLLAQQAIREGFGNDEEYKRRLRFYQSKALRDAYFVKTVKTQVTDEKVRAAYDKQAAKIKPEERVRARHILVATEKLAKELAARIAKGEKFEDLAKKYSTDGSKNFGGDLGYFTASEMVPAFSKAAFALKKGEVSKPVKTDFGWHLIKLEDRKKGGPQPFDQVKGAIKLVLIRQAVQKKVLDLRMKSKITILDPDLKKLRAEAEKKRKQIDAAIAKSKKANPAGKKDTTKGDKAN